MSDYWDHPEYGELEAKYEKQVATTRKWMALHDEAVERETLLSSEGAAKDVALRDLLNYPDMKKYVGSIIYDKALALVSEGRRYCKGCGRVLKPGEPDCKGPRRCRETVSEGLATE